MMQVSLSRLAIFGISSLMRTPGVEVWIDRNGPPVTAPGLGSKVSSWLAPPASQRRMQRLPLRRSSLATAGEPSTWMPVMSATRRRTGGDAERCAGTRAG